MANRSLRLALLFSTGVAGMMHFCADELSTAFYKTADAGQYIRLFSFLIPVMYLDSVTDGCLKGLGQQLHSMLFNITDALLNVILLYTLLPVCAIKGYIITVFICETMNFILSIRQLRRVTVIDIKAPVIITAVFSAAATHLTAGCFALSGLILKGVVFILLYIGFIYILNGVSRDDIQWLKRLCVEKNA